MVDWEDPAVIQAAADFYSKSLLSILGLYFWEVVVTFDFEKSFFSSSTRRPWRWHYASYFICRYSFLIATLLLIIVLNTSWPISCQVTYTVTQFFGNITIGTASLNLAFRTLAIWRNNRVLTVLMVTLAGGHWFVLLFCITTLKAAPNSVSLTPLCMITGVNRPWLVTLYVYTMAFDLFIMLACSLGLWRSKPRSGGRADDLYRLLWTDGLSYFLCASVANTIPVVFFALSLNPAMDVVSTMASACLTTIVSCRAVQRLTLWGTSNAGTQEAAYKMTPPDRSGQSHTRKTSSIAATGIEHGRKPWSKRQHFPTEGDVHLSSAMFARTVYMDNERCDPENGTQFDGQQKSRSDGGVFSLQSDDHSMASSPTMPAPWMHAPSMKNGSTGNDKDKGSVPYRPTTARVSESSEHPAFPTKPPSSYQTSESIEEDERESDYTRDPTGPPAPTNPSPRAGRRVVIEVGPTESGIAFGGR